MFFVKPYILSEEGQRINEAGKQLHHSSEDVKDVLRTLSAMKGFEECIPAMHRIIGRLYDEGTMYRKMGDALRIVSDFYIDCDRRTSELRASAGIRISTGTSTQQIVGVIEQPQIGSTAWQHLEALASVIQ